MAAYELWEMRSGNLVGSFPTKDAALAVVIDTLRLYGPSSTDSIALTREMGEESETIAEGAGLAHLALQAFPDRKIPHTA